MVLPSARVTRASAQSAWSKNCQRPPSAPVLHFQVKLRGIAKVNFDGNSGHALVHDLTAEGRFAGDVTVATTAPRQRFE